MSEREQLARLLADQEAVARGQLPYSDISWACIKHEYMRDADAILAAGFRYAPTVLREAADEFDKYDEVTIEEVEVGSNMVPVPPAERLRARADDIEAAR